MYLLCCSFYPRSWKKSSTRIYYRRSELFAEEFKQNVLLGPNLNSCRDTSQISISTCTYEPSTVAGLKTLYKPKSGGRIFAYLLEKVSFAYLLERAWLKLLYYTTQGRLKLCRYEVKAFWILCSKRVCNKTFISLYYSWMLALAIPCWTYWEACWLPTSGLEIGILVIMQHKILFIYFI